MTEEEELEQVKQAVRGYLPREKFYFLFGRCSGECGRSGTCREERISHQSYVGTPSELRMRQFAACHKSMRPIAQAHIDKIVAIYALQNNL